MPHRAPAAIELMKDNWRLRLRGQILQVSSFPLCNETGYRECVRVGQDLSLEASCSDEAPRSSFKKDLVKRQEDCDGSGAARRVCAGCYPVPCWTQAAAEGCGRAGQTALMPELPGMEA